jgi:uncharacterized protein (TIGR02145 family)
MTWMAENLNYQTDSSWCYGDNPSNCNTYGRLYTWDAANVACPSSWRLPTREDWRALLIAAGGNGGILSTGDSNLKAQGWDNGADSTGFSALPGGYRLVDGSFGNLGSNGNWWTDAENGSSNAYFRSIFSDNPENIVNVVEGDNSKSLGMSVRCVQD